jgi:hypothetical protein
MKNVVFLLLFVCCTCGASAQVTEQASYLAAKAQLEGMLDGSEKPSYEAAIFAIENAWYEGQIRRSDWDSAMDFHVHNVQRLYKANYNEAAIKEQPSLLHSKEQLISQYQKALSNWAIYTYITQPTLYGDTSQFYIHDQYRYSFADPMASTDWQNTQVVNLMNSKQGNCFALASLFKVLADRLQSGAELYTAPSHLYIAHEDEKGTLYNVELGSESFPGTGMISAVTYSTDQAIENGIAQRKLSPKQQVAFALVYLAKGYEHKYNKGSDSFLLQCANSALQYDDKNLNALLLKAEWLENRLTAQSKDVALLQKQADFVAYQKLLTQLYQLGYREMPLEMKNTLLKQYNKTKIPAQSASLASTKNGTPKASLTWGLYDERHAQKTTERYGNTLFDTRTKKISAFTTEQSLYNNYNFDPVVCAMNVDPLAHKFPWQSPYAAMDNSPIWKIDHQGSDARVAVQKYPTGGGSITISSTIYITGDNANKWKAAAYNKKAAEIYKSGSYTNEKGEKFDIRFNVRYEYASDKTKIQKQDGDNVLHYPSENANTQVSSSILMETIGNSTKIASKTANEGVIGGQDARGEGHRRTIHETLHFLGLSDRYERGASDISVPDKGFENDVMGSWDGKKLNQTHYDNYGKTYSNQESGTYILDEHVDTKSTDGSLIGGSSDGARPAVNNH